MPDITQEESEFCCDGMRKALTKHHAPFEMPSLLTKEGEWTKP